MERSITLQAEHLPGQLNTQADKESRTVRDRCDWKLNQLVIDMALGPLEVDLFASQLTKKLPRFYSWRSDPEAEATDAFMQKWVATGGFANPPMVPDTPLPHQSEKGGSKDSVNNTSVENSTS